MQPLKIIGVFVFLKKRKTQTLVGKLYKRERSFVFTYEDSYLNAMHSMAFGPEFPLTQIEFKSEILFPTFEDRIPSIQNPAYPEYCVAMGIDPKERDPLILLSTIGSKGPSSFIFYPIYKRDISSKDIIEFRNMLELTTREFASVFEFSQNSLNALENDRIAGIEILKRLEIILEFPEVAQYFLLINSGYLVYEKWLTAHSKIKNIIIKQNNEIANDFN